MAQTLHPSVLQVTGGRIGFLVLINQNDNDLSRPYREPFKLQHEPPHDVFSSSSLHLLVNLLWLLPCLKPFMVLEDFYQSLIAQSF